ncbi:MAG TPA: hypothetical protein VMR86_12865 [Myxococcota bacterium]|nr:hypothetical protein [Myxococcota bacterium]
MCRLGRREDLADSADLRVEVPAGWSVTAKPVDARGVHTYELRPSDGTREIVLVSAFDAHHQRARSWVEGSSRSAPTQSVEGTLAVESMCPGKDGGYYRAPEPDGYRYMTQVALVHLNHAVTLACDGAPPAASIRVSIR